MDGVGGNKRTCKGLFTEYANRINPPAPNGPDCAVALRYRQGIIAELMVNTASLGVSGSEAGILGDRTPGDMEVLASGKTYSGFT